MKASYFRINTFKPIMDKILSPVVLSFCLCCKIYAKYADKTQKVFKEYNYLGYQGIRIIILFAYGDGYSGTISESREPCCQINQYPHCQDN